MTTLLPDPSRSAIISPCGMYRYRLDRRWSASGPIDCWIGLNPSVADAERDDSTLRKICGFSRRWGAAGIVLVNLFAFRSTDPSLMMAAMDPIGIDNDRAIVSSAWNARLVIAAWGCRGSHLGRAAAVQQALDGLGIELKAIGVNEDGSPRHPLYVSSKAELVAYRGRQS